MDITALEREYKEVAANLVEVGDNLKTYHKETENTVSGMRAQLQAMEQVVAQREARGFGLGLVPSVGAQAIQDIDSNNAFANLKQWNLGTARFDLEASIKAALVTDGTGTSSDTTLPRQPEHAGLMGPVHRPLRLLDVLPSRPTTRDSVEFIQLSADGDASEQDQEGDEKAEIAVDGTLKTSNIVTIAAWTSASRQVLGDRPALQAQIDRMIRHKLLSRLEHQLINGTGGEGKIDGLLNQGTTFIPTIGTTPADIIGESLVRQADNGFMPSTVLMNPLDWFKIQITKSATEEEYVFGSPTMPVPPALWNVSVVPTPSIAEGSFATMDTRFTTVLDRESQSVVLSNSHADFFVRNLVAILGELRAGLEVLDTFAIYTGELGSGS